jgi:hypothetical protein
MRFIQSTRSTRRILSGLLFTALVFSSSLTPFAQQSGQGTKIIVTVTDQTGKAVPRAQAQLKQQDKVITAALSNEEGKAEFSGVAPGSYDLIISAESFETLLLSTVDVPATSLFELPATLLPKAVTDVVNVSSTAATSAPLEQGGAAPIELQREQVKERADRPDNVADTLPYIPGIARTDQGQLRIFGGSENRSALIVNSADVTDPATGQFGMTVPIDSVQTINIFRTPFLAQYGRFTAGVVAVDTRRGGEKWKFELNDPFPEMRYLGGHLRGLREATPRLTFNGPLIKNKLYFSQGIEYALAKRRTLALSFPNNETINESVNSFSQFDYLASDRHNLTGTLHIAPRKTKFFNLDFFNRRPVTPNFSARDYTGTVIDRWTLGENVLESTIAIKRAGLDVWAQGRGEMTLTPTGNSGNYFNEQDRHSSRVEWLETLSLKPIRNLFGTHNLKFGTGVTRTDNRGEFLARPINLRDTAGNLLKRIEFAGGGPYHRNDLEVTAFGQNHWVVTSRLAADVGLRVERQGITETFRIAPRFGVAWTPFANQQTVVRTGYGLFYDRVPLNVYSFDQYPEQIVTTYGAGGAIIDGPRRLMNITDQAEASRSPFIRGRNVAGNFAPYSATWNVEVEHPITNYLRVRANYQASNSQGLIILTPRVVQGQDALALGGGGKARYRQFELLSRLSMKENQELYFSYVRSRSEGDLNEFNNFLGSFPVPVIRPNQYSNLPGDLPHRFLLWGNVQLPWKMRIAPLIEWRTGFPYSVIDARQNYVGLPNADNTRFPNFFSLDARITRIFQINKAVENILRFKLHDPYSVKVSFSIYNLTNHFNPPSLHNNLADPQFGLFFGQNKRRFRLDFDIIF